MLKKIPLRGLLLLLAACVTLAAHAQGPYATWYFGRQAGLRFGAGAPQPLTDGQLVSPAACATLCTTAGNILCYSNGDKIWNSQHQIMIGGDSLVGNTQVSQGCVLLPAPNAGQLAYAFVLRYSPPGGSSFANTQPLVAEINLAAAGGLGQVVRRKLPVVADSILVRLGERRFSAHQALVRHANGTDYWLVTRLQEQGIFLASRITGGGSWPCPVTVVSSVFARRVGSASNIGNTLVASPNGQTLLYNDVMTSYLLKFDPATGKVSAPTQLTLPAPSIAVTAFFNPYCHGAAFSPDGSKCYLSRHYLSLAGPNASQVIQYNLAAASPQAVASSGVEISNQYADNTGARPLGMQRGADGAIYLAVANEPALDVIAAPNAAGAACQFVRRGQLLAGRTSTTDLPMSPNDANLAVTLTLRDVYGCAGQPTRLTAGGSAIGTAGDSLVWSLGGGRPLVRTDASGELAATYAAPGTYALVVTLRRGGRVLLTATATAYIFASPTVRLGADTAVCTPVALRLAPRGTLPAGSTLRWQDGSTGPSFTAAALGTYWVEVTSGGCTTRATITLAQKPTCAPVVGAPGVIPNIITPNGDAANDYFVLQGLNAPDWSLTVFDRWGRQVFQQANYANRWDAAGQPAGTYYYLLHHATTNQQLKGWVEVVK